MTFQFGPFTLDLDARQLTRDTRAIHLTPKALDLLATLVERRPTAISKKALQEGLWPDTFVVEANLSNLVAEIREALDDSARAPQFVRTAHGFGYAFCGEATTAPRAAPADHAAPACWLEWDRQRFSLAIGEHVIGRDPDVAVRLDRSTVSRQHARLIVTRDGAQLEDAGSKNGTFRQQQRVVTPVRLLDGDAIGIGSLILTFHLRSSTMSTETLTSPTP